MVNKESLQSNNRINLFNIAQEDDSTDEEDNTTTIDTSTPTTTVAESSPTENSTVVSSATPTPTTDTTNSTLPAIVGSELPAPSGNKTVNPAVCSALQKLYSSLNGNSWIVKTGWDSTDMSTCCSWFNVHCNGIGQVLKM